MSDLQGVEESCGMDVPLKPIAEPAVGIAPVLPSLQRHRTVDYREEFTCEYSPVGPTELAIVRDLARHAQQMELWGEATGAAERQAARGLVGFGLADGSVSELVEDAVLAGTMFSEGVDRCERHGLSHSKAFFRALQKLTELQRHRKTREATGNSGAPPPPFESEAACEQYLVERFRAGKNPCTRCQSVKGCYVSRRRCWECHDCKTQSGLRTGTVMARSPISLWRWFEAVRWLLWQPTISTTELSKKLDVCRPTTVRNMAKKIRSAMAADDCTAQLAGLDLRYNRNIT